MQTMEYAPDKPESCKHCFFWKKSKRCCGLGVENCYYLIQGATKEKSECDGCPYGRDHPCIGFCMKKVMREIGLTK